MFWQIMPTPPGVGVGVGGVMGTLQPAGSSAGSLGLSGPGLSLKWGNPVRLSH